jgi:hypothetical protein
MLNSGAVVCSFQVILNISFAKVAAGPAGSSCVARSVSTLYPGTLMVRFLSLSRYWLTFLLQLLQRRGCVSITGTLLVHFLLLQRHWSLSIFLRVRLGAFLSSPSQ